MCLGTACVCARTQPCRRAYYKGPRLLALSFVITSDRLTETWARFPLLCYFNFDQVLVVLYGSPAILQVTKLIVGHLQYMTDGVLLRETLKDADLDKYRYVANFSLPQYLIELGMSQYTLDGLSTICHTKIFPSPRSFVVLLSWMKHTRGHSTLMFYLVY